MAPKIAKRGTGGDTKGSNLSTRHTPADSCIYNRATKNVPEEAPALRHGQTTLYDLLGVANDVEPHVLKAAYRQKALTEHPDKGGSQDKFDAIFHAFNLLQDEEKRLEYDEQLESAASQAVLVEGKPETRSTGEGVDHKKTAPTAGSKRQKDWHKQSDEWVGEKSGAFVLRQINLALTDAVRNTDAVGSTLDLKPPEETLKDQTEALFKKYSELPAGKEAKQKWVASLKPAQRQALKAYAKVEEAKKMDKAKKWAAGGGKA